jgi:hypothetical protein
MGFKSREAREMVDAIRGTVADDATSEQILHAALYAAPSVARPLRISDATAGYGTPPRTTLGWVPRSPCAYVM